MLPYFVIAFAVVLFAIIAVVSFKTLPPHDAKDDLGFIVEAIGVLTDTSKK